MEIVYILALILMLLGVGLLIYLITVLLIKRVQKDAKNLLINKAISNKDKNCSFCNGNCEKFAEEVLSGKKILDDCPKISKEKKEELDSLLNITKKPSGEKVAHVFCKGGKRAVNQYGYVGPVSCDYSNKLFDGLKVCSMGCQGCLDCAKACPTNAIKRNKNGVAEVDRSLCIGCGACIKACPDGLIELIDLNQTVVLSCKQALNKQTKANVHEFCGVGCTKCKACVKVCPTGAIYEENDLIKFNFEKCVSCGKCVNICPSATISKIRTDFLNF